MDQGADGSRKLLLILIGLGVLGAILIFLGVMLNPSPQPGVSVSPAVTQDAGNSATLGIEGQKTVVERVIDGDTVEIETGQKVRYIGIDTPETVDPRRPVACFGKEASAENKWLVEGKVVHLVKDVSETDKFGRFLRYVYLPQEDGRLLFINDHLLRQGFARISTYPPDVKFTDRFLEAEREAKEGNRGLWQKCK